MIKQFRSQLPANPPAPQTTLDVQRASWPDVPDAVKTQMLSMAATDPTAGTLTNILQGSDVHVAWLTTRSGDNPDVVGWGALVEPKPDEAGCVLTYFHPAFDTPHVQDCLVHPLLQSCPFTVTGPFNVSKRAKFLTDSLVAYNFERPVAMFP